MSHPFRLLDPKVRSSEWTGRCSLTVMAKAPVPGKVKTRLSPPLTPGEAAGLNAAFLRDTLANLRAATRSCAAECVVSYTPAGQEAAFSGILPDGTLLLPQRGDGFGERLLLTARDLLASGFGSVCLIDSDSPTVPTGEFVRAAEALAHPEPGVVLGRSDDGGYYLLGLAEAHARLFEEISWSTELVGRQTAERAGELGLAVTELRRWYDVDDAGSLQRLQGELRAGGDGYPAPHTRAFLRALDGQAPEALSAQDRA